MKNIQVELKKFGLSQDQAKIYTILLEKGELRIQEIANSSHIPRSSVYECIKHLQTFGLIEKIIEDKHLRIKAYPIGNLRHLLYEKMITLQEQLNTLPIIERTMQKAIKSKKEQKTAVRYYQGKAGARQLLWNTLSTKSVVYVYSAFGRSKFVGKKFYAEFVRESKERTIREKVIINPHKRVIDFINRDSGSPLARTNRSDIRFVRSSILSITGETFMYDDIYAQVVLDAEEIHGFEIESSYFTKSQKAMFAMMWKKAKPVSLKLSI